MKHYVARPVMASQYDLGDVHLMEQLERAVNSTLKHADKTKYDAYRRLHLRGYRYMIEHNDHLSDELRRAVQEAIEDIHSTPTPRSEAARLYDMIWDTFIAPTAEKDADGNYVFYNDYGRRVFDPNEAKRIINYALAGSKIDRPSDDEIIDEVLDNAVWNADDEY